MAENFCILQLIYFRIYYYLVGNNSKITNFFYKSEVQVEMSMEL